MNSPQATCRTDVDFEEDHSLLVDARMCNISDNFDYPTMT